MPNVTYSIPLKNNWRFQVIALLLTAPVGAAIMLRWVAYRWKDDQPVRVGKGAKALLMVLLLPAWVLIVSRMIGYENIGYAAGRTYHILSNIGGTPTHDPAATKQN